MRRVVVFLLCWLFVHSFLLTGCSTPMSADVLLRNFADAYPLPQGVIFSSMAREGDAEYADEVVLKRLYGEAELPFYHSFCIYLYSDMDTVRECGIFIVRKGLGATDDIVKTQDLIFERIHLVELAFPSANSRVMRFGNTIAYVILPDTERAQRLLRSLARSA